MGMKFSSIVDRHVGREEEEEKKKEEKIYSRSILSPS